MAVALLLNHDALVVDIEDRPQAQLVLVAATAGATGALPEGLYDIWASTDVFIKLGPGTVTDVTANNGYLVKANTVTRLLVRNNSKIGALSVAGTTLSYNLVG